MAWILGIFLTLLGAAGMAIGPMDRQQVWVTSLKWSICSIGWRCLSWR